jgi:hypothetical protein
MMGRSLFRIVRVRAMHDGGRSKLGGRIGGFSKKSGSYFRPRQLAKPPLLIFKSVPAKKYLQYSGTMGCRSSVSGLMKSFRRSGPMRKTFPLYKDFKRSRPPFVWDQNGNQRNTDENCQQKRVTLDQRTLTFKHHL